MRALGLVAVIISGLLVAGVTWTANAIYGANLAVDPGCHDAAPFSPDAAKLTVSDNPLAHRIDPSVYAGVRAVSFPSRDGKVEVAGLLSPPTAGAPLIIATHGFTGCKHHKHGLSIIGMLASEGYGVLAIDLREHGESTVLDGTAAMGSDEYSDVLGAFDYAQTALNVRREAIGFWGESMGGATTLIANTYEDLGPLFLDAPYADIKTVLKDNADRASVPPWTIELIVPSVRLFRGHRLAGAKPRDGLVARDNQPIYWVHGTIDETVGVHHAHWAQRTAVNSETVKVVLFEDVAHVASMWDRPSEYRIALLSFFDKHLKG